MEKSDIVRAAKLFRINVNAARVENEDFDGIEDELIDPVTELAR